MTHLAADVVRRDAPWGWTTPPRLAANIGEARTLRRAEALGGAHVVTVLTADSARREAPRVWTLPVLAANIGEARTLRRAEALGGAHDVTVLTADSARREAPRVWTTPPVRVVALHEAARDVGRTT